MSSYQKIGCFLFCILLLTACGDSDHNANNVPEAQQSNSEGSFQLQDDIDNINDYIDYSNSDLKTVYFAGGCFWGVEAFFKKIYGVRDVVSGYANGTGENPSYQDVIKGEEGFVEAVKVTFDPERVDLQTLVDDLFLVIDPTLKNKQGNDVGIQYRTGVYSKDNDDLDVIQKTVDDHQANYDKKIMTEIEPLKNFYLAEDVHQDYLEKNPNGYCHIDLNVADDLAVQPIDEDKEIIEKYSVTDSSDH